MENILISIHDSEISFQEEFKELNLKKILWKIVLVFQDLYLIDRFILLFIFV